MCALIVLRVDRGYKFYVLCAFVVFADVFVANMCKARLASSLVQVW